MTATTTGMMVKIFWLFIVAIAFSNGQRQRSPCRQECTKILTPVCGSDRKLYHNSCLLELASCESEADGGPRITSAPNGNCPPIGKDCGRQCSSSYQPICATNGRTYDNLCHFNVAVCKDDNIKKQYEGVCAVPDRSGSSGSAPVPRPSDSTSGSSLVSRPSGSTSGSSLVSRPSGSTSGSSLVSRPSGSTSGSSLVSRPSGSTSGSSSSATNVQQAIGTPVRPFSSGSAPRPSSQSCPDTCTTGLRAVCGTDGRTYTSDCELQRAICQNAALSKRNDGPCVSAKDCSQECSNKSDFICGSNGSTYNNPCLFEVARCKDPSISFRHKGPCERSTINNCQQVDCRGERNSPVCGSDGRTYDNSCQLRNAACVNKSLLRLNDGPCNAQRCNTNCPSTRSVVCGSDGKTYLNHCILIAFACTQGKDLVRVKDGSCST